MDRIQADLRNLSGGDGTLLVAMRRRVSTRLRQSEGVSSMARRKLQTTKYAEQGGCCGICGRLMQRDEAELQCFDIFVGFTVENTQLVHGDCVSD